MIKEHTSLGNIVKKRLFIIVTLITLIILFLSSIVFIISSNNKNTSVMIDTFGKQRMLTQMIAKDVNRKYAIMLSIQYGSLIEKEETLNGKIILIDHSIIESQKKFEATLSALHNGKVPSDKYTINIKKYLMAINPTVLKLDLLWRNYSKAANEIVNSMEIDKASAQALVYINVNNEELMKYCDQINQEMLKIQKVNYDKNVRRSLALLLAVIILLGISIFQLQKYIVFPLNELYEGIHSMGLIKISKKSTPTKNEIGPIVTQINEGIDKLNKLIELISYINKDISFDETLVYIYKSFSSFIPYSHIGIALLKDDGKILEASYGISDNSLWDLPQKLMGTRAEVKKTSLGKIISDGEPRIINDLAAYVMQSDKSYNRTLLDAGIQASITLPLKINNNPLGIIFFSSTEKNIYNEQHVLFLLSLADSISISFNKNIFIDELLYSSVLALAKMAEARDEDTGDHLERMKQYSKLIAELLAEEHVYEDVISVRFIKDIERYSPMHDIGKVGIRDGILLKPAKLTDEEFDEMKKHTLYGSEVLKTAENNIKKQNTSLFQLGIEIAEGHHEKWNGSGYPFGKHGEDIPLSARIVAVADVFDALTSKRPYKKAFPFDESFDLIVEGRGKHFDPNIVDVFVKHKENILRLYNSFWIKN